MSPYIYIFQNTLKFVILAVVKMLWQVETYENVIEYQFRISQKAFKIQHRVRVLSLVDLRQNFLSPCSKVQCWFMEKRWLGTFCSQNHATRNIIKHLQNTTRTHAECLRHLVLMFCAAWINQFYNEKALKKSTTTNYNAVMKSAWSFSCLYLSSNVRTYLPTLIGRSFCLRPWSGRAH